MRIKNMKVYDLANELAEEIKKSEEYVTYRTSKEAINLNYELKIKIDEFENARYEAQIVALQTGKDDELKMKHVQELYGELIQNEEASKYFDAEIRFNVLIADVNKIIEISFGFNLTFKYLFTLLSSPSNLLFNLLSFTSFLFSLLFSKLLFFLLITFCSVMHKSNSFFPLFKISPYFVKSSKLSIQI